ncbi:hypothetical protein B0T19DRAFT_214023 [Cercophora scortea]|uniref:ATPase synthesis protein 25 n=1 Tax=Cercophora scortea TaxID=314031 RepID=A0AAE0IFK2_9PEZI|nr:hypothetical protein B0T19DRAFT_214023 [Cercophora scortea]
MGAAPAFRAAAGCSACRLSALRLFVNSFSTVRIADPSAARRSFTSTAPAAASAASKYSAFHATLRMRMPGGPAIEERAEERKNDDDQKDLSPEPDNAEVPWYLQVEPPRHPTLIHEPAPLPDIPEGAPKLVEPLVKFVSDELGIDDISLLDLREMDPPPALGPELLMVIGTARSERHLHVAADRLVRWLRGRGVAAKADGLLGRNELKIRLRRKARKAKLLGHTRIKDDGITTGWICINIGTVGWSDKEVELVDDSGRQTGFGVPQSGTTIVVQMLIESRRQELELEKLWNGQLKRSLEQASKLDSYEPPKKPSNKRKGAFSPRGNSSKAQDDPPQFSAQRFFSTSARRVADAPFQESALGQALRREFRGTVL